jgi:RNA polymerase sigma-70 factor (ECF subfamily)
MATPAASDESLMTQYSRGDVQAFETLYARYEQPVWRFLLRRCGNTAQADELMQEVWFAVARAAARFRPEARFAAWLYTLARNRAIDSLRATRPQVSLDSVVGEDGTTLLDEQQGSPADVPDEHLERAQLGEHLLAAIARLPDEQREAFLLQAEGELSVADIATVMGASFETTKSRLRYARNRLRELLREHA